MFRRITVGFVALAAASLARAEVVVELVPQNPGPYVGGEALTVDVWLHSEVSFDVYLFGVVFDFSDTDPSLSPGPTFTFDLSAIPNNTGDYGDVPELPVPSVGVITNGPLFPENMLPLPAEGRLHIGSVPLQLPITRGVYRLDALNANEPNSLLGARIDTFFFPGGGGPVWRAFTGEITGGSFDFIVGDPIPTVSDWGLIILTLLIVTAGSVVVVRRRAILRA